MGGLRICFFIRVSVVAGYCTVSFPMSRSLYQGRGREKLLLLRSLNAMSSITMSFTFA
jgi:hypothetical protein